MKSVLEKLDLNNIDKSTWESFRFEEITNRVAETVDPKTTDLKTYVGLEHIDAENIHIKRFGTPDDVSGGKLKCYPGDVIFGKRRAYQRKAAVVDFEGICSAHAFVFRANPKVIDPKLFPFFLHSDQFMHRAVDISVGGLSPTINWGDLKGQEFLLPPKAEQALLAELLWAMDEVIEKEKTTILLSELLKKSIINKIKKSTPKICEIKDLFDLKWGNTNITKKSYVNEGYTAFSASGPDGFLLDFEFDKVGIVLSAIGAECGKCFKATGKWTAIKNTITLVPLEENDDLVTIAFEIINDKNYWPSSGGAQPFISQTAARKSKLPKLDKTNITQFALEINKSNKSISDLTTKILASQSLQKSLINQIF
jgi:type I restriction enzyme S subunit